MSISLIVAMSREQVIGRDNQIPWHLPADLGHFKKLTTGKTIVMGRRTYESIGKPLPNRHNVVVTRQQDYAPQGVTVLHSFEAVLEHFSGEEELMIIGGNALYQHFLPLADRLYITEVDCSVEGDTCFPTFNPSEWEEVSREAHPADLKNPHPYSFVSYLKR